MVGSSKFVRVLATAALVAAPHLAQAADKLEAPLFEQSGQTRVEFGTGWYIRGDIGAGLTEATTQGSFESFNGDIDLGIPVTGSVGVGYRLSDSIRAEATFNQFSNLSVSDRQAKFCGFFAAAPITGSCYDAVGASPNIASVMASAYLDLGEYYGLVPYIGAGIGAAFVSWRDFTVKDVCIGDVAGDCDPGGGIGENVRAENTFSTEGDFALAYNLMLGAGYRLDDNWTLDFGYRYTSIGEATLVDASNNTAISTSYVSEETNIHEFRVGLRYEIW